MKSIEKILDDTIKLAKEAGEKALFYYDKDYKIDSKSDDSPVTQADVASNDVIIKGLEKYDYGILSEESTDNLNRLKKDRVWIIDPLDGTSDFINKTGEFTIMIGLAEKGKSILGIVYKPIGDVVYYAIKNQGAYKIEGEKKEKLKVSSEKNWGNIKMLTSRFHLSEDIIELSKKLEINKTVKCGSAGLKIGYIADKKGDLNINTSSKTWEWDICAADIVLTEAGGRITDIEGEKFVYNKKDPRNLKGYIVSNNIIHEEIIKNLKKYE